MPASKLPGDNVSDDPDDAPELLPAFFEDAELRHGERVIRSRGRGRPKLVHPKRFVTLRLDADLVDQLRETGPGWQSRVNQVLRSWMDDAAKQAGSAASHVEPGEQAALLRSNAYPAI
ncbi:BrnA antitoxin family protein [Acidisphaera sp. S103]|uniref:BrnA antitoxin family protein n=1 Tax=Acidisphaera sp. S103 TaxID=1747223 RepID=UPI00131C2945|nr:BrnA antitoxin family protein [Acidisphaera sp. S103]